MDKAKVNWDLESIFPGGSSSLELRRQLEEIKERLARLGQWVEGLIPELDAPELKRLLDEVQDLVMHFSQCSAFVGCLTAQNVHDAQARLLEGDLGQMGAALGAVQTRIHHLFADIPQDRWEELLSDPDLKELEFYLNERRKLAQRQMDPQRENLAIDLAVDGYHAWSQLYYTLVGRMGIEVERDGSVQRLSMGQAANLLADPDPQLRREVFAKYVSLGAGRGTFRQRPQPPGRFPPEPVQKPGLGRCAFRTPGDQPHAAGNPGGHVVSGGGGQAPPGEVPEAQG